MANVIAKLNRPTMILAHNKTLAAQLYGEMREFFPHNAVEYFVSYYDYYQPEAYVPSTDTFIEKDSSVNAEVERLRHSTTNALLSRRDVVVVSTVSFTRVTTGVVTGASASKLPPSAPVIALLMLPASLYTSSLAATWCTSVPLVAPSAIVMSPSVVWTVVTPWLAAPSIAV